MDTLQKNLQLLFKKQWFIESFYDDVKKYYLYDENQSLGTGSFGIVFKATCKRNNYKRAIKKIQKSLIGNRKQFEIETNILKQLDHPNIIKMYETFEDADNVYLVMELCEGGELFYKLEEKGYFNEKQAKEIFKQIMSALNYCHNKGVCHRDIKLENFLFLNQSQDIIIKLIDFGMSKNFNPKAHEKNNMKTLAGTTYYISPEVLNKKYDESCDIWSAGVILYILICGMPPFYGNSDDEIFSNIKQGKYDFKPPQFKVVSKNCINLIKNMIAPTDLRYQSQQVLNHQWLIEVTSQDENLKINMNQLKQFRQIYYKIVIMENLKKFEQEVQQYGAIFNNIDQNKDGTLTLDELKQGLYNYQETESQDLIEIFEKIDTDKSGTVDYSEFLVAMLNISQITNDQLNVAFNNFDYSKKGLITADGLYKLLGNKQKQNIQFYEQILKEVNIKGVLNKPDFVYIIRN